MSTLKYFDVAVMGGGPAGYSAAIRVAQLGAKVCIIERDRFGGACLNYACVPTKFLRYTVEILRSIEKSARYGIIAEIKNVNWREVQARRQSLIDTQVEGLSRLLMDNGIELILGEGKLLSPQKISVGSLDAVYEAQSVVLATGSNAIKPAFPGAEEVISSRDLLSIAELPRSLAIIGGGPVGIELATIFARFGVRVSVVELMTQILPEEDPELVGILEGELKNSGVHLYTGSSVTRIEKLPGLKRLALTKNDNEQLIEAETVVSCIGLHPQAEFTFQPEIGLKSDRGAVEVDEHLYTGVKKIYAAGDITGKASLAYVAMMQGKVAAENIMGNRSVMEYDAIPHCILSMPELASVGLSEKASKAKGFNVMVGRFPFAANTAASIYGERRGMVKVVGDSISRRILGVQILGFGASLLIHEASLAVKIGASITDIQRLIHAHPNLSEALFEAALDATGESLSINKPYLS